MKYRSGKEIRDLFVKFWVGKGSRHYPSFSLTPDDPSLLFTIAGMVPFKAYYLGIRTPEAPHAVTCQKCVRTNDIENVGRTARHHTFFEMLGNFAWGSYFKREAITWAWEFLTEVIGLDSSKMYASIYQDDQEANDAWRGSVGLSESRILRFGRDENYWFMGERGPCGPCSEIYYDRGEKCDCGSLNCGVGCDCDRYMEIWNLVFTQYDRQQDGTLIPLPRSNIDTGMGLERLTSLVQGVETDYESDLFMPLITHTCARAGVRYGECAKRDMAVRVIADHARSVAFMLADGILPANDGPGYVLRRLLRRAARYGRLLGFEGGFLHEYLPILIEVMGDPYRELIEQRLTIEKIMEVEESRFAKTLAQGTELFEAEAARLRGERRMVLSGDVAFALYDTYGFPLELTLEMAEEQGLSVDKEGFEEAMKAQRQRARAGSKQKKSALTGDLYTELENELPPTVFTGYAAHSGEGKILALLAGGVQVEWVDTGAEFEVVLDATPFYAERGGQVGDAGKLYVENKAVIKVLDTTPQGKLIIHKGKLTEGARAAVGMGVRAQVDDERRAAVRRNHTATHLLHEALSRVLGGHVRQAGSLVTDRLLRFDYTHHEALSREQIEKVEEIVNVHVLADTVLDVVECSLDEARARGAKALFDEKYGEVVRVVTAPGFSVELCGGLHVRATGEVGLFKILREESVGSGTRRVVAVTGMNALGAFQRASRLANQVMERLSADESNLTSKTEALLEELRRLQRQVQEVRLKELAQDAERVFQRKDVGGVILQTGRLTSTQPEMLRDVGDRAKGRCSPTVVVMSVVEEGECRLTVMADDAAVKRGVNAGALVKEAAALLGGRGGGRPGIAQGGGRDAARLDEVLVKIETLLEGQLNK
ncbi:MAG: alanine--tRNA ligase [Synergistaceae bacterium]|jgi:alanyl-tRNA synthetase|nr:alanine--tRNA ligase [Synergistaceae bacterium]